MRYRTFFSGLLFVAAVTPACPTAAQSPIDIEQPPFAYSDTPPDNRVSRLIDRLAAKEIRLHSSPDQDYLPSILQALEISEASQTLVFSKTSMQVQYISHRNPRAIYFNDDTYVGWVHGSSLMEISTFDPKLGAAFYTVDMDSWRPKFEQATYDCLSCHATSMTQGLPGHTVRSVQAAYDGTVDPQRESFITSDASPFAQRWGGWYVTGLHGDMKHLGNAYLKGGTLDTHDNGNRIDLVDQFDTRHYLSPRSDIVALMVLEHQTQTQNTLLRADFEVRQMLHQAQTTATDPAESELRLQAIARRVVDALLFCDEQPLPGRVAGFDGFVTQFEARGVKDSKGRSLREFDLQTRMFKYPCSYLIHTAAFQSLQPELRRTVEDQLHRVLTADSTDPAYDHLDKDTRHAIASILRETCSWWPRS